MAMNKTLIATLLLLGCGREPEPTPQSFEACGLLSTGSSQALSYDKRALWQQDKVSVCWINPSPSNEKTRKEIQADATAAWDDHLAIDFVWLEDKCTGCEDVRIEIADDRPYAIPGAWRFGGGNGIPSMVLNFTFKKLWTICNISDLSASLCARKIAVHEFGHLLGFAHEKGGTAPDYLCIGDIEPREVESDLTLVGGPDPSSVMAECTGVMKPSANDISAAIEAYGAE